MRRPIDETHIYEWASRAALTHGSHGVVRLLREDAEMRKAFLDKVAALIANKLLE